MHDVTLTWAEVKLATTLGVSRNMESLMRGRKHVAGDDKARGWDQHIEGVAGEMAFAKWCGRYYDPTLNTFKTGGDGVGNIQIRTSARDSLLIRPGDHDNVPYVMVYGRIPTFCMAGWILGADAKREEWGHTSRDWPLTYFVPVEDLRPMSDLVLHEKAPST